MGHAMGHRLRFGVKLGPALGLAGVLLAGTSARAQYNTTGPSKCVACHDHGRQATKWQKEEPAAFGVKAHFNTRKQLDGAKAGTYAKAIGLADPYDLKGSCVRCHATVFRGDANAGVSCESCHGAASGYLDVHQVKGSHAKSVAAGLKDLREKPAAIARVCVDCHVTPDRRLAVAGHPSGSAFDAGASLQKIVHWTIAYNYAQVSAAGKTAMAGRVAAPPVAPSAPSVAPSRGSAPVVTASKAPAAPPPASAPPAAAPPAATPPAAAAPAAPPPAPWDWDQPIRPLPKEYVPEPVAEPTPEPVPEARPAAPATVPPAAAPAPRPRPAQPRPVPPSIAEDTPLPRSLPALGETSAVTAAVTAVGQPGVEAQAGVRSAAARVVELRGRGVVLLERLLRAGTRVPSLPAPARPAEFSGPDSELLRLQDEATALALEALRRPQ